MENIVPDDDGDLIERCIGGDDGAWTAFAGKYSPLIRRSVEIRAKKRGIRLSSEEAEEIRQDVLTAIWREKKLADVRDRDKIECWLAVVSARGAMAYVRTKLRRECTQVIPFSDDEVIDEITGSARSSGKSPWQELDRDELRKKIMGAIGRLPPRERLMVRLHLLYGKRYEDISGMLHLPIGTVASCIKRAREKLQGSLEDFLQ
ncbi:MAG: sigma-70 family RNA polymerase sigma factor [Candidatus Omnitrophota bacterium]